MKRRRLGVVLLGALAIGFAFLSPVSGSDGSSSPEVRVVDAKSLPEFKADFNADLPAIRIVLLLSPT